MIVGRKLKNSIKECYPARIVSSGVSKDWVITYDGKGAIQTGDWVWHWYRGYFSPSLPSYNEKWKIARIKKSGAFSSDQSQIVWEKIVSYFYPILNLF